MGRTASEKTSIRFDLDDRSRLSDLAEAYDLPQSDVVRKLIREAHRNLVRDRLRGEAASIASSEEDRRVIIDIREGFRR